MFFFSGKGDCLKQKSKSPFFYLGGTKQFHIHDFYDPEWLFVYCMDFYRRVSHIKAIHTNYCVLSPFLCQVLNS